MSDPSDSSTPAAADNAVAATDATPTPPQPSTSAATVVTPDTTTEPAPAAAAEPADPAQTALPEEDEGELAWHKATLIAEEDIRERVTIPAAFAAKYLWSPSVPAPKSPSSDESSSSSSSPSSSLEASSSSTRLPGQHPTSHVNIPPALLADAHAALSTALSSATQLASVHPKPPPPPPAPAKVVEGTTPAAPADPVVPAEPEVLTEPIITLFAPFDNTASVIDTIISGVGQSQRADVLVLDALMLAQGEAGPLGSGKSLSIL